MNTQLKNNNKSRERRRQQSARQLKRHQYGNEIRDTRDRQVGRKKTKFLFSSSSKRRSRLSFVF